MELFAVVLCAIAAFVPNAQSSGVAPLLQLNSGRLMPSFGLGTWLGFNTKGTLEPVKDNSVELAVQWSIDAGYRHIDTAAIYDTEEQVGRGVISKLAEGVVKREDLFITTKLWNNNHAKESVVPALQASLKKLNMDYVDLYLIHWPIATYSNGSLAPTDYVETWEGMVEAQARGLTRSIGVSNFNRAMLERLAAVSAVKPAVLQVEVNLNLQQPDLLAYCRQQDIQVVGYTPFGSLFPSKATADSPPPRVDEPALLQIAAKYNKTVPQVALRYLMDSGVTPIPKSITKSRIEQNIDVMDFTLTEAERSLLKGYDRNYRTIAVTIWKDSPYYPFEK